MTPSSPRPGRRSAGGLAAVRAQLGDRTPGAVARLTDAELEHLASAIDHARRREAHALAEAGDRALSLIPRLLRGPVRRIVGA